MNVFQSVKFIPVSFCLVVYFGIGQAQAASLIMDQLVCIQFPQLIGSVCTPGC